MTTRIDSPTTPAAGGERHRTVPIERTHDGEVRALHSVPLPLTCAFSISATSSKDRTPPS